MTTKPARSCERMTLLPSVSVAKSRARVSTSSLVSSDGTSSTSFSTGTGLKKWTPRTFSGRRVAIAIFMIGIEEVLLARIASGLSTILSSRPNTSTLSASRSMIASIVRSRSAKESRSVVNVIRPRTASCSSASSLPRSAARCSDASTRCRPRSAAASSIS